MSVEQLGDGVYTASDRDHRSMFVLGDDGAVVLGGLGGVEQPPQVAAVIATIDHLDHSGAVAELADGAELVAHELCSRVMERRGARGQRPADRLIRGEGEELTLAGVRLRLLYPGPTQGTGNLAVHLPDHRVLFLVGPRADARYGLLPDFHLRHVTRCWRELAALDVDVVVPGRGALMDREQLIRAADYIDALKRAAQEAFAEGVPIWVIQAMEPFVADRLRDRFGDLEGFDRHVGIGAIRVVHHYLMGGWGMEDTAQPEALFDVSH